MMLSHSPFSPPQAMAFYGIIATAVGLSFNLPSFILIGSLAITCLCLAWAALEAFLLHRHTKLKVGS